MEELELVLQGDLALTIQKLVKVTLINFFRYAWSWKLQNLN